MMVPAADANTRPDWIIAAGTVIAAVGTVSAVGFGLVQASRLNKADLRTSSSSGRCSVVFDKHGFTLLGR